MPRRSHQREGEDLSSATRAMEPEDYRKARRSLMGRDPVLAGVIRRVGACGLADGQRTDAFAALVEAIIWQQLSTKAAASIYRRVLAGFGNRECPPPAAWLARTPEELRAAGLSRAKVRYILDLCARVEDGRLPLDTLDALPDAEVIRVLTDIKGIGQWTAEMFLMFRLHRPDILPLGDLGIVRAFERLYRLRKPARPHRMRKIAEAWRPYRSVACWYLWASDAAVPVVGT